MLSQNAKVHFTTRHTSFIEQQRNLPQAARLLCSDALEPTASVSCLLTTAGCSTLCKFVSRQSRTFLVVSFCFPRAEIFVIRVLKRGEKSMTSSANSQSCWRTSRRKTKVAGYASYLSPIWCEDYVWSPGVFIICGRKCFQLDGLFIFSSGLQIWTYCNVGV